MTYYSFRRQAVISACLLPLLFAGACAPKDQWTSSEASHIPELPKGDPWSFEGTEGRIIETLHYRIYTTVTDALLLEKIPAFLESSYQNYLAFLPSPDADEKPLHIYLFQRRSEWEEYTRQNTGPLAKTYLKIRAGAYSHNSTCVAYLLDRYHTLGILAHEGFHQFSSRRLGHRIPAWMEEGLACNFEAHVWKSGEPVFTPDLNEFRISALKKALRNDLLFPLSDLLAMQAGHAVELPPEKTATFYAQAWALTRFLQEGRDGKYRPAFRQLLDDAADGANLANRDQATQIFQSYFKDNLETIDPDFVQYAHFLAARQIMPGMEVFAIGAESPVYGKIETIRITAEQIAQPTPPPQELSPAPEAPQTSESESVIQVSPVPDVPAVPEEFLPPPQSPD